jgi:uncharacterized protein YeaC (DUF1315 family)
MLAHKQASNQPAHRRGVMAKQDLPSIDELRNKLRYDPDTGFLFSRKTKKQVFTNVHHSGYLKGAIGTRTFTAHRVAMAITLGEWPNGEVDHINGNRSDNRFKNLRVVTKSENQRNAKLRSDNTSGHVGVSKKKDKWIAKIKEKQIGTFKTKQQAIAARKAAEQQLGGFSDRHGS